MTKKEEGNSKEKLIQNTNERREITNVQEIKELEKRLGSIEQIPGTEIIRGKYTLDEIEKWGITDISFFKHPVSDVNKIKKLMEKMPLEVIPMPRDKKIYDYNYSDEVKQHDFIKKYGIDNIVKLENETEGLFSHKYSDDEIYLLVLAIGDEKIPNKEINETFTYKDFKNRIYEILKYGKERGGLFDYYPTYNFIKGDFRKEYKDIFIDENIDEKIKNKFYKGELDSEDIQKNPELIKILKEKDLMLAFKKNVAETTMDYIISKYGNEELLNLCATYGKYFSKISADVFEKIENTKNYQEMIDIIEDKIFENILSRKIYYDENAPDFLKEKHPELFIDNKAPEELKSYFYNLDKYSNNKLDFKFINQHPEYVPYIKKKLISRAMPKKYEKLFSRFDNNTILKLGKSKPNTIEKMVDQNKEEILEKWYKSTQCKFIPNYIVMLEFPDDEIDKFLKNGRKWSKLMQYNKYNKDEEWIKSILKASYVMGVFHNDDRAYNKIINLLEKSDIDNNETLEKFIKIFSNLDMNYNKKFAVFLHENFEKIIENNYITEIEKIQEKFNEIVAEYSNQSNGVTLERAIRFVDKNVYKNVDIGNEKMASTIKKQGYLQNNEAYRKTGKIEQSDFCGFDELQELYNEGMKREFSSIPRVKGKVGQYTYEILRLDDPLALVIGVLSDCCQDINGIAKTSMKHSIKSKDGRIFVIRDSEKNIVAQSWVWRNQDVICFDNIEIPRKAYERYMINPQKEDESLTKEIITIYKKVARKFKEVEYLRYEELLKKGEITREQYEGLLLGKVTIGLGFNMIKSAMDADKELKRDEDPVQVKTDKLIGLEYIHSDAYKTEGQQIVYERKNRKKTKLDNIYVYEDTIKEYNTDNIEVEILESIRRMLISRGKNKYIDNKQDLVNIYGKNVKILSTPRMNFIYVKKENGTIEIKDILTSPIKKNLPEYKRAEAKQFLTRQVEKALKQIGANNKNTEIYQLEENSLELYKKAVSQLENEIAK